MPLEFRSYPLAKANSLPSHGRHGFTPRRAVATPGADLASSSSKQWAKVAVVHTQSSALKLWQNAPMPKAIIAKSGL